MGILDCSCKSVLITALVVGTVFALVGAFCSSIALAGNAWQLLDINTEDIMDAYNSKEEFKKEFLEKVGKPPYESNLAYSRSLGILHQCFYDQVPKGYEVFSGPFGQPCVYRWGEIDAEESSDGAYMMRSHLLRAQIVLFIIGLVLLYISLVAGLCGCWMQKGILLTITGVGMFVAAILLITAMIMFHSIAYVDREITKVPGFPATWPKYIEQKTHIGLGWSYFLSWAGITLILTSSIILAICSLCIRLQLEIDDSQNQSMTKKPIDGIAAENKNSSTGDVATLSGENFYSTAPFHPQMMWKPPLYFPPVPAPFLGYPEYHYPSPPPPAPAPQ